MLTLLSGEELLPGWYDDWVLAERESLEQLRLRALDRLARQALDRGDLVLAIDAARSATEIEPHSEAACEVALRAHLARGDRAGGGAVGGSEVSGTAEPSVTGVVPTADSTSARIRGDGATPTLSHVASRWRRNSDTAPARSPRARCARRETSQAASE